MALDRFDAIMMHRVSRALNRLQRYDSYLLKNNASERCICHKFAEHLQRYFSSWNVDCEYNLNLTEVKVLNGIAECSERKKTDRVFPDIIIHKRGKMENLLVVEVKKKHFDEKCDEKKLELFTALDGDYRYALGLFVQFNGIKISGKWFKNGQPICENIFT